MRGVWCLPALLLSIALLAAPAQAQLPTGKPAAAKQPGPVEVVLTGKEKPETIERMIAEAAKSGASVTVRIVEPPAETKVAEAERTAPAEKAGFLALLTRGTLMGLHGVTELRNIHQRFLEHHARNEAHLTLGNAFAALLVLLLCIAAAFAVWKIALRLLDSRDMMTGEPQPLATRVVASIRVAIADGIGILVFLGMARALNQAIILPMSESVFEFKAILIDQSHIALAYLVAARFLLRPHANGQRLLPIPHARDYRWPIIIYSLVGPLALTVANVLHLIGAEPIEITGWFMLSSTLIAAFKTWFFWSARHDIAALILSGAPEGTRPGPLRSLFARITGPFLAAFPTVIWLFARIAAISPNMVKWSDAIAATQFYVVLGPIIAAGAARLVHNLLTRSRTEAISPLEHAVRETGAAAVGAAVWVLAVWDLSRVWSEYLDTIFSADGLIELDRMKSAAMAIIVGYLCWTFLLRLFEGYMPKPRSAFAEDESDDHAPTIQSRLSSVLPVLRGIALIMVAAITLLIVLTRLGVDTAPLLAGFGIAGLALSFGSQALVRDVVSGIFFLADDAFRVGEYIDTGKLKGTVERITLRAVQLRHQSGLVHTIPYGQLQSVTNASRDWATIKFQIRLDRTADIEKTRKTIKKIGQELMKHPEFGTDFIMPVKLQGIVDIQDNALVARVKFTAKPFRTSQIQREALKRIYLGLTEAGIPLATNSVNVRSGSPEAAAAAFAAANTPAVQPTP